MEVCNFYKILEFKNYIVVWSALGNNGIVIQHSVY